MLPAYRGWSVGSIGVRADESQKALVGVSVCHWPDWTGSFHNPGSFPAPEIRISFVFYTLKFEQANLRK